MSAFVRRHPVISLAGTMRDAFGTKHEVDDRIEIAEVWNAPKRRCTGGSAAPRIKSSLELKKTSAELTKIDRSLSVLAHVARGMEVSPEPPEGEREDQAES